MVIFLERTSGNISALLTLARHYWCPKDHILKNFCFRSVAVVLLALFSISLVSLVHAAPHRGASKVAARTAAVPQPRSSSSCHRCDSKSRFQLKMVSWSPMSCCRDAVATGPPSTSARRPKTSPISSGSRLYECNSLLAVLLQPYRHVLVTTEILCPGPPVRRGRWWQYTEVGSSCNLTAWNAMTLLVRNKNVTSIEACSCWWRIGINKVQFVVVTPRDWLGFVRIELIPRTINWFYFSSSIVIAFCFQMRVHYFSFQS